MLQECLHGTAFLPGYAKNSLAGFMAYDFNNKAPLGSLRILRKTNYFDMFQNKDGSLNYQMLKDAGEEVLDLVGL